MITAFLALFVMELTKTPYSELAFIELAICIVGDILIFKSFKR